jgi:hypothetical protein
MSAALLAAGKHLTGAAHARWLAAATGFSTWSTELDARAARLDEMSRAHDRTTVTTLSEYVASTIVGAAIIWEALQISDERDELEEGAAQVADEMALGAALTRKQSTVRDDVIAFLNSPV